MQKVKNILVKYKTVILYIVFGGMTTAINIVSFAVLFEILGLGNVMSNILAWILSVMFAFVTNKLWVFDSKSLKSQIVLAEIWKFISCRLITGGLDLAIMYVGIDVLAGPAVVWKILANVVVIILNYAASKLLIFREKPIKSNTIKREEVNE